jgi:hypothetical protein
MYKKISFRSVSKPGRETAPGFSVRGRGARAQTILRRGKAHPAPLLFCFVEALNTPVVAPVICLFGGRRDSLFLNPFK